MTAWWNRRRPLRDSNNPGVAPGTAVAGPDAVGAAAPGAPAGLDPDVQVVRFQGPPGLNVEVLAPTPTPVPAGDGGGIITVGLKRGVGYRLRITNIPERPRQRALSGHRDRRPSASARTAIDPGKYPIRVVFNQDDLDDALDRGRLVTKVIYLEDPDQAIPFRMAKDQIPVVTLNPTEPPLRVASCSGPAGGDRADRRPAADESRKSERRLSRRHRPRLGRRASAQALPVPGSERLALLAAMRAGLRRRRSRRLAARCRATSISATAVTAASRSPPGRRPRRRRRPSRCCVGFDIGLGVNSKPRVLPTNVVCVYAPRFAEVRISTGTNQAIDIQTTKTEKMVARRTPSPARPARIRAAGAEPGPRAGPSSLARFGPERAVAWPDEESNARGRRLTAARACSPSISRSRPPSSRGTGRKPVLMKEGSAWTGSSRPSRPSSRASHEGTGEAVKVWGPHSMTGVETPPDRPGLAVIKRVSAAEAEPGDTLTYVDRRIATWEIRRSDPSRSWTACCPAWNTSRGPRAGRKGPGSRPPMNRVGSTELRWELPGILAPGARVRSHSRRSCGDVSLRTLRHLR